MVDHTVVRLSPRNPEDDAPWPVQVRSTSWYLLARSSSALVGHTALELSGNGGGGWKPQVQFSGSFAGSYRPRGASNHGCAFRSQYRICEEAGGTWQNHLGISRGDGADALGPALLLQERCA